MSNLILFMKEVEIGREVVMLWRQHIDLHVCGDFQKDQVGSSFLMRLLTRSQETERKVV